MTENTTQLTLNGNIRTTLVNRRHTSSWDVYIGRADGGDSHMLNTDPGQPGWLGNPYTVDEYGREECVERFKEAFAEKLVSDEEFREAVDELRGDTLACWCTPKKCHGDVIVTYLEDGLDAIRPNGQE